MRKYLIISAIGIGIISVTGFIVLYIARSNQEDEPMNNPIIFPTASTTGTPSTSPSYTRQLLGIDGSTLTVSDFTAGKPSQQVSDVEGDVQYDLTPYPEYVLGQPYPTHSYDVAFDQLSSQFIISLNEEPLGKTRLAAEAFMRQILGLANSQLCNIRFLITVPSQVNEQYSATNLGISSCPGAVPLPI
jgi:hypothetical protein